MIKPFPAQSKLVVQSILSLRMNGFFLNTSDMGSGKTYMALWAADAVASRIVVICPKVCIDGWASAAEQLGLSKKLYVTNYESLTTKKEPVFGRWLRNGSFDPYPENQVPKVKMTAVFDEVHDAAGNKTKKAQVLLGMAKVMPTQALSATVADSPLRMWALGYLLGAHRLNDFYPWCQYAGATTWGTTNGLRFDVKSKAAQSKWVDVWDDIRQTDLCGGIQISDIPEMPEEIRHNVFVDGGEGMDERYEELLDEFAFLQWAEGGADPELPANAKILQEIEQGKLKYFVSKAGLVVREGGSVYISLNSRENCEHVHKAISSGGFKSELVLGGDKDRTAKVERFQKNKSRVIVGTPGALGVGTSLHDIDGAYPRVSIISPNFNSVLMYQTYGRIFRAGGKSNVQQFLVFFKNSEYEERMANTIQGKVSAIKAVNKT